MKYYCDVNGTEHEVELVERLGELCVKVDGEPVEFRYEEADRLGQVVLIFNGGSYAISIEGDDNTVDLTLAGYDYRIELEDERERAAHAARGSGAAGGGVVKSVMPGMVVKVLVSEGEAVEKGTPLLVLEAMKMQNEIASPGPGVVGKIKVAEGQAVGAGTQLITLLPPAE